MTRENELRLPACALAREMDLPNPKGHNSISESKIKSEVKRVIGLEQSVH